MLLLYFTDTKLLLYFLADVLRDKREQVVSGHCKKKVTKLEVRLVELLLLGWTLKWTEVMVTTKAQIGSEMVHKIACNCGFGRFYWKLSIY